MATLRLTCILDNGTLSTEQATPPLRLVKGEDAEVVITVLDNDRTAHDLAGDTIVFAFRERSAATGVQREATPNSPSTLGITRVTLVPGDTNGIAVKAGEYVFDVWLCDDDGLWSQIYPLTQLTIADAAYVSGSDVTNPTPSVPLAQGPQGEQGIQGEPGADGVDGTNGSNGTNGTNGADGAGVTSSGFALPSASATVRTIYANTAGNDSTGNGTIGNPYRTPEKALAAALIFSRLYRTVVDLTDLGTHDVTNLYQLPTFDGDFDVRKVDGASSWRDYFVGGLSIVATPTTERTFTSGEISSQVGAATTGITTITHTQPGIVADSLVGKLCWGAAASNGLVPMLGAITANDETTFEISWSSTGNGAMTYPIKIGVPSANLRNVLGNPVFALGPQRCGIVFAGIDFTTYSPTYAAIGSISWSPTQPPSETVYMVGCRHTGVNLSNMRTFAEYGCVVTAGVHITLAIDKSIHGQSSYSALTSFGYNEATGKQGAGVWRNCVIDTCAPHGSWTKGRQGLSMGALFLDRCAFRSSGSVETAIFIYASQGDVTNCTIDDSPGSALNVQGFGRAVVQHVHGSANGGPIVARFHGQINVVDSSVDVAGTGGNDLQVGLHGTPISWATFRALNPQVKNDFGSSGDGSVIFEETP
jgi:hypothetical protein